MKMMKKTIRFLSIPLLCGLGVFLLFRFVLFLGYVPSASMEPTIPTDSLIVGTAFMGNCNEVILLSLRETELAW